MFYYDLRKFSKTLACLRLKRPMLNLDSIRIVHLLRLPSRSFQTQNSLPLNDCFDVPRLLFSDSIKKNEDINKVIHCVNSVKPILFYWFSTVYVPKDFDKSKVRMNNESTQRYIKFFLYLKLLKG